MCHINLNIIQYFPITQKQLLFMKLFIKYFTFLLQIHLDFAVCKQNSLLFINNIDIKYRRKYMLLFHGQTFYNG